MLLSLQPLATETSLHEFQAPETKRKTWSKEDLLLMEEDQLRDYLSKPDIDNCISIDGVCP